jgi:hypothetical protein
MRLLLAITFIFLMSCGHGKNPEDPTTSPLAEVKAKYERYLSLVKTVSDPKTGFIAVETCDSLLFTALTSAGGYGVDIKVARDEEGRWWRRPGKDCGPQWQNAKSTISRDMLLGVLWGGWVKRDLAMVESLFRYAVRHNLVMGDGDIGATLMNPNIMRTIAEMISALGGPDHKEFKLLPYAWGEAATNFRGHLQVLHIVLKGAVTGSVSDGELQILKSEAERLPWNALYQAAYHRFLDGNQSAAISALMNEKLYPASRLPASSDRCEPWILQRDGGKDLEPCPDEGKIHSGGDLIFPAAMVLNYL